jgi:hypothetical protein
MKGELPDSAIFSTAREPCLFISLFFLSVLRFELRTFCLQMYVASGHPYLQLVSEVGMVLPSTCA